ncbi:Lipopolysaccharide core biosynthesis glycosyltransferase KdtX [Gammaproteobacteria bacterium]
MSLSVIVITKNEESCISRCLASVSWADELIVVDSGSTDRTLEICQAHGSKIKIESDWLGFGIQKNRALALAGQDWVLSIDADEWVSETLRNEIQQVLNAPASHVAFSMPRQSSYCGKYIRHSGWSPDRIIRLFRRGYAQFSNDLVHERLIINGSVGRLSAPLMHESYQDLEEVLNKINSYSTLGAQAMEESGKQGGLGKALSHGTWAFFRTYFLRAGFLDGKEGLMLAISNAEVVYYRYLKGMYLFRKK